MTKRLRSNVAYCNGESFTYKPGNGITYTVVVVTLPSSWVVSWDYDGKGWQSFEVQQSQNPLTYTELGDHLYRHSEVYVFIDFLPILALLGEISGRRVVMPSGWTKRGLNKIKDLRVWGTDWDKEVHRVK